MSVELKSAGNNSVTYYFEHELNHTFTPADWASLPESRIKSFLSRVYLPVSGGLPQAKKNYWADAAAEGLRLEMVTNEWGGNEMVTNLNAEGLVEVSFATASPYTDGIFRIALTHSITE